MHLAHATTIPFENLDILLGRGVRLDMTSLQAKMVAGGRGGYCFEQDLLFAAALERIGFSVVRLAARVRYRNTALMPKTHMTLIVEAGGVRWLCDVGFGAEGLLKPVPFGSGESVRQFAWSYRVVPEDGAWVLQSLRDGSWLDLYAFTMEPQHEVDYVVANHFTSTYPESRFVRTVTAQLPTPEVRWVLRGMELVEDRGERLTTRALSGEEELLSVLGGTFGLRFPLGTRFKTGQA
ncbi:MAG: arylamine N-acetyltransferase [Acidobacteriota bacterium]